MYFRRKRSSRCPASFSVILKSKIDMIIQHPAIITIHCEENFMENTAFRFEKVLKIWYSIDVCTASTIFAFTRSIVYEQNQGFFLQ